eukprot:jgi/Ulvmu1/1825/UM119_0043.1
MPRQDPVYQNTADLEKLKLKRRNWQRMTLSGHQQERMVVSTAFRSRLTFARLPYLERGPIAVSPRLRLSGRRVVIGVSGIAITGNCDHWRMQEMDVSALVSEAVREAVHAAAHLDLGSSTPVEIIAGPALTCPDAARECGSLHAKNLAGIDKENHMHDTEAPKLVTALEVPGQPSASLRLHKAKIRALERELQAVRSALENRTLEIKELRQESFDARSERMVASRTVSGLEQQLQKLHKQLEVSNGQVAAKEMLLRQYKDDNSTAAAEKRRAESESKAQNARLNRALDEVQRFRKDLEDIKHNAETKDSVSQVDYRRVLAENKKLERQKSELLAAFKKQGKLISVLKKQKIHVETSRLLQFTEKEFVAALQ